jgi:hypothetical protein
MTNFQFANRYGYTDITPYEVVRAISEKTREIRAMDTERDTSVKLEFHAGGFAANCSNQNEQKWFIKSNPDNRVFRIRLGKNGWKSAAGDKFRISDKPIKFYDYNF